MFLNACSASSGAGDDSCGCAPPWASATLTMPMNATAAAPANVRLDPTVIMFPSSEPSADVRDQDDNGAARLARPRTHAGAEYISRHPRRINRATAILSWFSGFYGELSGARSGRARAPRQTSTAGVRYLQCLTNRRRCRISGTPAAARPTCRQDTARRTDRHDGRRNGRRTAPETFRREVFGWARWVATA